MKLSFSTLGCPDWSIDEICERGKQYGYQGVGIRGILGEMDLTKMEALSDEHRAATVAKLRAAGLEIVMLGSSARFTSPDPLERNRNLAEGKAAIDLADKTAARMVRVYGGVIPDSVNREEACDWVVENLQALGDYAKGSKVIVAVESHDDFTDSRLLRQVLDRTSRENVRVLWDISNCYRGGERDPAQTWKNLEGYVVHTHFKDSMIDPSQKLGYRYCLMGEGDVPNIAALQVLKDNGWDGFLSFEWEKVWHPGIPEAAVAFPQYVEKMREYLKRLN